MFIKFETMTELQLAFQVKAQKALVEINVPLDFPENDPTINLFLSSEGSIRMKKFDMKRHFASEVFGEVHLFHEELLNILKEYNGCLSTTNYRECHVQLFTDIVLFL